MKFKKYQRSQHAVRAYSIIDLIILILPYCELDLGHVLAGSEPDSGPAMAQLLDLIQIVKAW